MDGEIDGKKTAEMTFLRYIQKCLWSRESKKTQTFGVSFSTIRNNLLFYWMVVICISYFFLFINFNINFDYN